MTADKIKELLELKDYLLTIKEYMLIFQTSPQIRYMNYDKEKDIFEFLTDEGQFFELRVYNPNMEKEEETKNEGGARAWQFLKKS